ncbi:MAG: hypothetical protein VKJ44_08795 [Synechococcus sp.]|nr:hypothetical protein [Synechococcus sp.]
MRQGLAPTALAPCGIATRCLPWLPGVLCAAALALLAGGAQANTSAVPAIYATRAEAEEAARKHFHCSGAHPMGKHWMPCARHGQAGGTAPDRH